MKKVVGLACLAVFCAASFSFAADKKDERGGKCADAKSQMDYFCSKENAKGDTLVSLGTACNNAKDNVAAACEGKAKEDLKYEFNDSKKK
jgi:hypothetical protein